MLKWLLGLACWLLSPAVLALTITDVDLNSYLNQPLDARIVLQGASASEISTLKIELRSMTMGNQRHTTLHYELKQDENGIHYIQITTKDAVREPILSFILEANWSDGRFLREYSLIMDPQ